MAKGERFTPLLNIGALVSIVVYALGTASVNATDRDVERHSERAAAALAAAESRLMLALADHQNRDSHPVQKLWQTLDELHKTRLRKSEWEQERRLIELEHATMAREIERLEQTIEKLEARS